jgi:hypothetical protein
MGHAEKLKNFPHIYCLNIDSRDDRWQYMESQFQYWNMNYTRVSASKYLASNSKEWSSIIHGSVKNIPAYVVGTAVSHFEMLKAWLNESTDEYVVLMEDDYDLNLLNYWNFDWDYLMSRLPYDWDCIQLGFETQTYIPFFLHPKTRASYFGPVMITRDYAEKILDLHTIGDKYCLNKTVSDQVFKESSITVDYFIGHTGNTYCIPLITTNTDSPSTEFSTNIYREHHNLCRKYYYWWWLSKHKKFTLDDFFTYGKSNDTQMTVIIKNQLTNDKE